MLRRLGFLLNPFDSLDSAIPSTNVRTYILQNLKPMRLVIGLSLAFTLISAVLEVWLIYYTSRLVDTLSETPTGQLWDEHLGEFIMVAALVLLIRPLAHFGKEALDDLAFRPNAVAAYRWHAHRHVVRHSVGWFQNDLAGRIATRVRDIGLSAAGAAYTVLHTLSFVLVYIIGSIWLMASVDARLVIPLVIWIGLYGALMVYAVPRFRDASEAYQEATSALTGLLVDTYGNIDIIKSFAGDSEDDPDVREHLEATRAAHIDLQRVEVTINTGMMTLGTILLVGLICYSVVLWQAGDAPLGIVAAALALSFRINGMAEWLLDAVASLFGYAGAVREALKTVAQPVDIVDAPDARDLGRVSGAVSMHNVSQHYGKGDGGLDRISLEVDAGEKVGLVGRSGVGKSTLVNLLTRFFDPETGRIEIDGHDIQTVTQDSLRSQIAIVSQDASLLHRSIRDNIAFGRSATTQAQIEAAASKAAAHDFIVELRDMEGRTGYDAHAGERGVRLSGGQRQRIALARAILKDAPILILDEATSALDSHLEAEVLDTLYDVMHGKTVIAIAHRLSTIAQLDRIIVLENGRIVEQGTHSDLLAQGGLYAGLWERQSGGFLGQ